MRPAILFLTIVASCLGACGDFDPEVGPLEHPESACSPASDAHDAGAQDAACHTADAAAADAHASSEAATTPYGGY